MRTDDNTLAQAIWVENNSGDDVITSHWTKKPQIARVAVTAKQFMVVMTLVKYPLRRECSPDNNIFADSSIDIVLKNISINNGN